MVENGEWVVYRKKRRLMGVELPFTVVEDNNGDCWIVQFRNLKRIEPQADKSFELVIPKFIKGIIPAKDIFEEVLDTKTQRVVLKVINPNFSRMKKTHLSNREAINLGDLAEELRGDLSIIGEFPYDLSIRHLIINGNNIKLQGQLEGMFSSLHVDKITFKDFDATNITDLRRAFSNSKVRQIDFTGFKQSNIKKLDGMFNNCSRLQEVDISNLKLDKLTGFTRVFMGCTQIREIILPRIEIIPGGSMQSAFEACEHLEKVNTHQIVSSHKINITKSFDSCRKIKHIDLSNIHATQLTAQREAFSACSELETVKFKPNLNIETTPEKIAQHLKTSKDTSKDTSIKDNFTCASKLKSITI